MKAIFSFAFFIFCLAIVPCVCAMPTWVTLNTVKDPLDASPSDLNAVNYSGYFCTVETAKALFGGASVAEIEAYVTYHYSKTEAGTLALGDPYFCDDSYTLDRYDGTVYNSADWIALAFYGDHQFRVYGEGSAQLVDGSLVFDDASAPAGTVGDWKQASYFIPEPSCALLMLVGAGWLMLRRRRVAVGRALCALAVLGGLSATAAAPSVTITHARQRYPWNNKVDVVYELELDRTHSYGLRFQVRNGTNPVNTVESDLEITPAQKLTSYVGTNTIDLTGLAGFDKVLAKTGPSIAAVLIDKGAPDPLVLDYGDGVTFEPWDYLIVDLQDGTITTQRNVQVASAFQDPVYKTTKMVFRRVPAGSFLMQAGRSSYTNKKVTFTKDYFLAIYPCTQKQYETLAGATTWAAYGIYKGDDMPCGGVNWHQIVGGVAASTNVNTDLAGVLNGKIANSGYVAALPNEAQWERAARAGTTTAFFYGASTNNVDTGRSFADYAVCGRYTIDPWDPVGGKLPNAWGFYDMYGNVSEWCSDLYSAEVKCSEQPGGPVSSAGQTWRVQRGGQWDLEPAGCSSIYRECGNTALEHRGFGFRFVLNLEVNAEADEPGDPEVLDYGDGVTFVPGDYLVFDLSSGSVTTQRNVEVAATFQANQYKRNLMVFRKVPKGSFLMQAGSEDNPSGTKVTLADDYYIAIYPCTQSQYKTLAGGLPSSTSQWIVGDYYPCGRISWLQVAGGAAASSTASSDLLTILNGRIAASGYMAALPNEAQWERAARAGSRTLYVVGPLENNPDTGRNLVDYAVYGGSSYAEVGSKAANAWGLYDMFGNVTEWCSDAWVKDLDYGQQPGGSAGDSSSYRVTRGGNYANVATYCSSVSRRSNSPDSWFAYDYCGLRLVVTLRK